jgi:phage protein D
MAYINPEILRRGRTGFTPVVFCSVDGRDISSEVMPRLIEATVTDGTGLDSDGLTIVIDNAGDVIGRPRKKAVVVFGGGFKETGGPIRLGTYEVEDAEKTFLKRTLTIIARAAKIGDSMKVRKHRAFDGRTIGEIVEQIAGDHGLQPAISSKLASIKVPYRAQLGESDANLLTWLGGRFNAVASAKDGRLVFARKGDAASIGGSPLPVVTVGPNDLADAATFRGTARAAYGRVRAYWHDQDQAIRKMVEEGDGDLAAEITEPFQDEDEAREAVKGRKEGLEREEETLSLPLWGRPDAQADAELQLVGCDKDADGKWSIETVEHKFSGSSSYTTSIEAKRGDSSKGGKSGKTGGGKAGTPPDLSIEPPPWEVPKGGS